MNIKVFQNRKVEKDYFYSEGTQNENNITVLTFEVPLGYEDFSKRIVFITEDGNFWDYIPENEYKIKNDITKYGTVEAYLWLTKDDQDFRSQKFELNFYKNENADNMTPNEEQLDGFGTLIAELDLKIAEVEALKIEIGDFREALNSKASKKELKEVDNKFNNYYPKTETYNKTEIDNKISVIPKFNRIVVDELPTENIQEDAIYLIPSQGDTNDLYREYIYIDNKWELIGIQKGDLSNIYTKQEVDEMVKEIQETNEYQSEIIDQFKNEFKQITVSGDSIYIPDAAELPIGLIPYGEPVQEVIEEELGTTVEGESVVVADGDVEKEVKATVNGNSYQFSTEGYQLLNVNDKKNVDKEFSVDSDDYITVTYDNSNGSSTKYLNYHTNPSSKIKANTTYLAVLEIKKVSGNGTLTIISATTSSNKGQFKTPFYKTFSNLTENSKLIVPVTSVEDISDCLTMMRTYCQFNAGASGSITFRISILPDTTITADTFVYEKYTGGQASPNIEYPQEVEVITECSLVQRGKNRVDFGVGTPNSATITYSFENDILMANAPSGGSYPRISYDVTELVKRNAGKTIYFNVESFDFSKTNNPRIQLNVVNNGKTSYNGLMSVTGNKTGYTIPSDTSGITNAQLTIYINNENETGSFSITLTKPILSFGENDTYEPYIEPIVKPINLQGNSIAKAGDIKDLLNIGVDGTIKLIKNTGSYIFTGNENYVRSSSYSNDTWFCGYLNESMNIIRDDMKMYATRFNKIGLYGNILDKECINNVGQFHVRILASRLSENTAEGYKALLKEWYDNGEPLKVLFCSATPITIELPSIEPITLFEGTNVFELVTNLGTTMAVTYDYVTPSPSIDRPSEILTVQGGYDTELENEDASKINTLPLTLTKELLGEIVTLTEEEASNLGLDGAGKYRRMDYGRYVFTGDEDWQFSTGWSTDAYKCFFATILQDTKFGSWKKVYQKSNYFIAYSRDELSTLQGNGIGYSGIVNDGINTNNASITIKIERSVASTVDEFKAWLKSLYDAENPMEVIYELVAPIYEKITDETELAQLSAYDKQIAFFGVNNINTFPTDDLEKAPLKIHTTYSKSNKLTIQSLEDRLASLESQVTNLQDNQI